MTLKKTSVRLFMLLALISCGKGGGGSSNSQSLVQFEAISTDPTAPIPRQAQSFRVSPRMMNFTNEQESKVNDASELIERVIASEQFRKEVLNFTFNGKKEFNNNNGLSNAQIYEKILEGQEKMLRLGKNNRMDVELELYSDSTTTIGYTFPNVVRIYMNTKYFNNFDASQVSDNMVHEWLHKIGFDHDVQYSPSRDYSVPYAIGYIVKRLAKQYMTQGL